MSLILAACQSDEVVDIFDVNQELEGGDLSLIGTAVNFQPYTDGFSTRANGNWLHNGEFNTGDLMYIYRQFWINNQWTYDTPPGTLYKYIDKYNGVTGIFDRSSWKPFENKWFCFTDEKYTNPDTSQGTSGTNKQWSGTSWENNHNSYAKKLSANDSIIWESGKTVRFRAWILSNLGNNLNDLDNGNPGFKSIVYPDYLVCDWVTVAGPTEHIPMAMRHLGCRLAFSPREYNVFTKIELCTDPEDYERDDNADSTPGADEKDKVIKDDDGKVITAAEAAANVKKVFEQMCWPAGVDIDDMSLTICDKNNVNTKYSQKTLSPEDIASNVKRPVFDDVSSTSRWYMLTTPYDMSKAETYGEPLHLPNYTRFKIWLRDVNGSNTTENEYHIFSLSDAKKVEIINGSEYWRNEPASFVGKGINLMAGDSYLFYVGYHHNKLEVWAADTGMSWDEQDNHLGDATAEDERHGQDPTGHYTWFSKAISMACESTKSSGAYQPEFIIKDPYEFWEFIKLVNGEFKKGPSEGPNGTTEGAIPNDRLLKKKVTVKPDGTREVEWYKYTEDQIIPKAELEEEGYIFYDTYTPAIGTQPSVIEEDYLKEPYTFYNELLGRHWTVKLTADLDLRDYSRESIGQYNTNNPSSSTYFAGYFNGDGHTIKNIYCHDQSLFGYVKDGIISNLKLESTYQLNVVDKCSNTRLLGVSLKAPGSLAKNASGTCYFVGCIHEGDSNGQPLVEYGERVYMYGCMQAAFKANGSGNPALGIIDGTNLDNGTTVLYEMIDERDASYPWWGNIACNYYDTDLWKGAKAFTIQNFKNSDGYNIATKTVPRNVVKDADGYKYDTGTIKNYSSIHRKQYIRGVPTDIMCAKTDFLIDAQTKWSSLTPLQRIEIYGVAPWKAMNYAIYRYNYGVGNSDANKPFRCVMHYEVNDVGFNNRYPVLLKNEPTTSQYLNVMEEFN